MPPTTWAVEGVPPGADDSGETGGEAGGVAGGVGAEDVPARVEVGELRKPVVGVKGAKGGHAGAGVDKVLLAELGVVYIDEADRHRLCSLWLGSV